VDAWGKKGECKCKTILDLRKVRRDGEEEQSDVSKATGTDKIIKHEVIHDDKIEPPEVLKDEEPERKRARGMTLEEYEAALDGVGSFFDQIEIPGS